MESEVTLQSTLPEIPRRLMVRPNLPIRRGAPDGPFMNSRMVEILARSVRRFFCFPLLIVAAMWALVLLAPHLPGIPRPSGNSLPWRQEFGFALLLTLALGFLLKPSRRLRVVIVERRSLLATATLGLFAVWILLSAAWAVSPYSAIHLGLQWSLYLAFFAIMISLAKNPRIMHSSLRALAGVVCVLAIACAIESWFGAQLTDGNFRSDLKPLLRGSGGFGEIMAMAAILFAGLSLHNNHRRQAIGCGVTAILAWLATIQSLERAPFVGASAGFGLLIVGAVVAKSRSRRTLLRLSLLVAGLALVLFSQTVTSIATHSTAVPSTVARLNQNLAADNNARARFLFWGVGLEMARAHPLLGVGGNNYEAGYAAARAQFSAANPNSSLIGMNEHLLTIYAHNEYIQLLAELGVIGFLLFLLVSLVLFLSFWRAARHPRLALPALGAGGAMLAFAISSGASGSSFRYFGGGLLFFFAAAIVVRIANTQSFASDKPKQHIHFRGNFCRVIVPCLFAFSLLIVGVLSAQATGTVLHGLAQGSSEPARAERYYQASLRVFPPSAATHFSYGMWLYQQRRGAEGVTHLSYALERGFNSSICYAYLAGAADSAGDPARAEQTLAAAVRAYPVSVFLLVRHATALARIGRSEDAKAEFSKALLIDSRAARGWQQLIDNDIDAALAAAQQDKGIALPGELAPASAVFEVLQENEQRFPEAAHTGFRARMRAEQKQLRDAAGQPAK